MDIREKLVELQDESDICPEGVTSCFDCQYYIPTTFGKPCDVRKAIADKMIANGVTFAKDTDVPSKWISVKDRLPEVATSHNTRWDKSTDSIRVLCACVQADGKKMVKEGYCKVCSDGFVHWKIPGTIHSVTHWQYLPQPPKGE